VERNNMPEFREALKPRGRVEIFVARGAPKLILGSEVAAPAFIQKLRDEGRLPKAHTSAELDFSGVELISTSDDHNLILNGGRDKVLESLTSGFALICARMSIGDRGTIPSDQTVPKVPTADMTALYNEIYRSDNDAFVLTIGVPNPEVKFIKTFSATVVPITSFSNQAQPMVNEVGLVMADLIGGAPLPRADVAAPNAVPADEKLFGMRTFKSVPFEAANEITVTIRYTIFIE
jgi:hypothetical protein